MDELTKFNNVQVLVVGDVMLDRYWMGVVDRISPEAPVPVVSVESTEERCGGAGNVASNVVALGAECSLVSVVGDDQAGDTIKTILKRAGIDSQLLSDQNTSTTVKLRIISQNQQLLRADFDNKPSYEILKSCLENCKGLLNKSDVVIISDYGKGGLLHISEFIEYAVGSDIPVIVDPKGSDFSPYRNATMITPNRREFEMVVGECLTEEELYQKAMSLISDINIDRLLITESDKGMRLLKKDGSCIKSPATAREVYDVSGAGDTVIAVMAVAHAVNMNEADALRLSNAAAGVVIAKLGTATASIDEINSALKKLGQ